VANGDLDQAKAILTALPHPGEDPCVATALTALDKQREHAAHEALDGQSALQRGDRTTAEKEFQQAQQADRTNADAIAGLAAVARLKGDPLPTAGSNWQYFYTTLVSPIGKLLLPLATGVLVLGLASSLLSRFLVRTASRAWPNRDRRTLSSLGTVLVLGTSAMLPIYEMFRPFDPGPPLCEAGAAVLVVICLLVLVLLRDADRGLAKADDAEHWEPLTRRSVYLDWRLFYCPLFALPLIGLIIWRAAIPRSPHSQLMLIYALLVVMGLLITSAGFGQNLRLQIEAQDQDGRTSAASTDYLLARMLTLGDEQPRGLRVSLSHVSLSSLDSESLRALPAGPIVATFSRLLYTLRPDLTWRARVTEVDCNRISVTLTRNGRHAESTIFSRLDLGLPALDDRGGDAALETAKDRAHAQLLTGAAAYILVHLSQVHGKLRGYLSGARSWKAVTLQVIATSRSLIDTPGLQLPLLARAVNEDPWDLAARFDYLYAAFETTPAERRDQAGFARAMRAAMTASPSDLAVLKAAAQLEIRVRHSPAVALLTAYFQGERVDDSLLNEAATAINRVLELCRGSQSRFQASWYARQMLPAAEIMDRTVKLLQKTPDVPPPPPAGEFSPRLAWDRAMLEACDWLENTAPRAAANAVADLRFAVLTEADRQRARQSPALRPLRQDPAFRRLVGLPPTSNTMLDRPRFASFRDALLARGLDTPRRILGVSATPDDRDELARDVGAEPADIQALHDLAELATLHPLLDDSQMLNLLDTVGVGSRAQLDAAISGGTRGLITNLRERAAAAHLSTLPGVLNPLPWMDAAA
jgi:hypothetical protein